MPLLISHFVQQYNNELNKNIKGLSTKAERKLISYNYPGNIRELSNIIEYAMVLSNNDIIRLEDLPEDAKEYGGTAGS